MQQQALSSKCIWFLLSHKAHGHSHTRVSGYHKFWKVAHTPFSFVPLFSSVLKLYLLSLFQQGSKEALPAKDSSIKEAISGKPVLKDAMKFFDADIFNDSKVH